MVPSNQLDKYVLRHAPGQPWLGALPAYDSACDQYSAGGLRAPIPTLRFPLGGVNTTRPFLFRVTLEQPCNRVTLYFMRTVLGSETDGQPTPMFVELYTGCECAEESAGVALLQPQVFRDAGEIMTVSTSKLFSSIAIGGITRNDLGALQQGIDLRLVVDWRGQCCPIRYGPLAGPVQPVGPQ